MNMVAKTWWYEAICIQNTSIVTNQHDSEVYRDHGLKKECFEVVWHMGDDDEKNSGDVNCEDSAQ